MSCRQLFPDSMLERVASRLSYRGALFLITINRPFITQDSSLITHHFLISLGMLTKPFIQLCFGGFPPQILTQTFMKILVLSRSHVFQFGILVRMFVVFFFKSHNSNLSGGKGGLYCQVAILAGDC